MAAKVISVVRHATAFTNTKTVAISNKSGEYLGQFYVSTWTMKCCGMGELSNLTAIAGMLYDGVVTKEEIVAAIYLGMVTRSEKGDREGYIPWNLLFTTTANYWDSPTHPVSLLLKEMGAKELDRFDNLAHGPNVLVVGRVNLKDSIGKFIDEQGNPLVKEIASAQA
jgi:hypothetical protein